MTDFYLWMCNLFVLVAYISEELNVVTRFGSCCCLIGFILCYTVYGFFMDYLVGSMSYISFCVTNFLFEK